MSRTVIQLRHAAARSLRDLWKGTLTTAGSIGDLQLLDTALLVEIQNGYIHVSADAAGEDLRIRTSGHGQIQLAGEDGLNANIAINAVWEAHRIADVPTYNSFIHEAILDAGGEFLLGDVDDQTIGITANAVKPGGFEDEYAVPSGIRYVNEFALADSQGYFHQVPLDHLKVISGSTKKIRISEWALVRYGVVGAKVRLIGQSVETVPSLADSSIVKTDPAYILAYMKVELYSLLAQGDDRRASSASGMLRTLEAKLQIKRETMIPDGIVMPSSVVVLA